LLFNVDESRFDNPVALVVGDVVVQPQNAVCVDPPVRPDDRAVVETVLLPDLTAPGLVLEKSSVSVIRLVSRL